MLTREARKARIFPSNGRRICEQEDRLMRMGQVSLFFFMSRFVGRSIEKTFTIVKFLTLLTDSSNLESEKIIIC